MKKIKKRRALSRRWLAMLLTLAMCLGTLPFSAFAADGSQDGQAAVESYQDSTPSEAGGPENDGGQVVTGDADESNDDGNEIVTGDADESNNGDDEIVTGDENESNDGDDEIVTGDENESNNGDDQIITGDEDESDDDQIVTGDEEEDESDEEEQNGIEDASVIPDDVKAFLDAVAAIPKITPENAEEVAEYVYGEVSDCYEVLLDTEYMDREDVQEAEAVYAAAIEAIDAALDMESEDYYTEPLPGRIAHDIFYYNGQPEAYLYLNTHPNNPMDSFENPSESFEIKLGETEKTQRLYTHAAHCIRCSRILLEETAEWIAVEPNKSDYFINGNSEVVKDEDITWSLNGYAAEDYADLEYEGFPALEIGFTGSKPGETYLNFLVWQEYYYEETGRCSFCRQPNTAYFSGWIENEEMINIDVTARYQLDYELNGGSGSVSPTRDDVADTSATLKVTNAKPTAPKGKKFLGWADTSDAEAAQYQAGSSIELTWTEGYGTVDNPVSKTLYAVWGDDDTEPDAPTYEQVASILGKFVKVQCVSDPVDPGTSTPKHALGEEKIYSTIGGHPDSVTIGEVEKKADGKYYCTLTIHGDAYADYYGYMPQAGTGVKHTLQTGKPATQTVTLKWNSDKTITNENLAYKNWEEANGEPRNTVLATFPVVCKAPTYTVTYTDGVTGEEVFKDESTPGLKKGDDTPVFKGSTDRDGYTFMGWSPTLKAKVDPDMADADGVITYTATWQRLKLSAFTKELVTTAAGAPKDYDTKNITFPKEGKVILPKDGSSVTLLYKITVTGEAGALYAVTDDGATWASGDAMEGKIPDGGEAVIYVTKSFTKEDIDGGYLVNEATVKPGKDNESSTASKERTPAEVEKEQYTLRYDANGGTGAPNAQGPQESATFTISSTEPTKADFAFAGWADSKDAKKATYQPGEEITLTESEKTLYAVWAQISVTKTMKKLDGGSPGELLRAGDNVRYTVTVKNTGSNPLENLQFFDDMDLKLGKPAKITIDSGWNVTSSYYPADEANPKPLLYISADGNKLAPGASVVVQYEAEITKADGEKVINIVNVYADIDKSVENVSRRMAAFRSNDLNSGASSEGDTAKTDDINVGTGDNGDRPTPPTGGVSGSGSTGGNGAGTKETVMITINWVDDESGEVIVCSVDSPDKGDAYDYSELAKRDVPKDKGYALISIPDNVKGIAKADDIITVTCGKDAFGPTDENDPTKQEKPDGIPDKFQAVVTYKVEHGTWDGTNVTKEYVFTLYEEIQGVWTPLAGDAVPTLDGTIPDVKGATPDKGYTAEGAAWNTTPTDSTPVTEEGATYTYSFKEEVPAEDATVTYPEFNGDKETGTPDTPPTAAEDKAAPGTTIIVNPNGGSWVPPTVSEWNAEGTTFKHIAADGETITLPDPEKDGYVFVGWTKEEAEDGEDNTTITYTAQWAADTRGNDGNGNPTEGSDGIPDVFQPIVTYTVSGGTWEGTNGATVKKVVFNLVDGSGNMVTPTLNGTIPTPVVDAETNTAEGAYWDGPAPADTTAVTKTDAEYRYVFPPLGDTRTITVNRVHNGTVIESIDVTVPEGEGYTVTDTVAPETFDNGGNHYIRTDALPTVPAGSGNASVNVAYAIDNIGGGANGSSPDGIPDNLEAVVYYRSSNTAYGTVRDAYQAFDLRPDGGSSTVTLRNAASTLGRAVFTNWASGNQVLATGAALENEFTVEAGQTYTVTANFTSGGGGTGGGGGGGGGGTGSTGNTNTNTNTNTDTNTNDNTVTINDADVPLADLTALNREDHFAYVSGYTDGTVRPTNNITREEVAAIFYRLLTDVSRTVYETGVNNFSDVDSSRWSNNAVSTLANAGIISGYTDGTFKPGQTITRAEFAAIAARFDDMSADVANPFTDTAGHWAEQMISSAADKGWVGGYPDNTFRPKNAITRAEAMTLINNVLDREVDEAGLLADAKQWPDNQKDKWYYYEVLEATNSHDYTRRGSDSSVENWTAITQK